MTSRAVLAFGLLGVLIGSMSVSGGCSRDRRTEPERVRDAITVLRRTVHDVVGDPARRDAILREIVTLEREVLEQGDDLRRSSAALARRNADPSVGSEEFEVEVRAYLARRNERRDRLVDIHFRIRSQCTAEEWPSIVDRELELLGSSWDVRPR